MFIHLRLRYRGKVLGHDPVLDRPDHDRFEPPGECRHARSPIKLSAPRKSARPRENGRHGICGRRVSLEMLIIVPHHRACAASYTYFPSGETRTDVISPRLPKPEATI